MVNEDGVLILLGKGDGTFQQTLQYPAGTNPISAALGDFNGGEPDLAVVNYDIAGTVSVLLHTCPGPELAIARGGTAISLSWPLPSTGFILESTPNLGAPNWQPTPEAASTNNGRWEVTVPIGEQERYFRLHKL